jgi:hypothetical protein
LKSIEKLYIPILHNPSKVPAFGIPKSIISSPLGGSIFLSPSSGMVRDAEQSKVPAVFIINFVGISALAFETLGKFLDHWKPQNQALQKTKLRLRSEQILLFFCLLLYFLNFALVVSTYYILNNGGIIPSPASPERSAKSPSPITTTPADLKKSGA